MVDCEPYANEKEEYGKEVSLILGRYNSEGKSD